MTTENADLLPTRHRFTAALRAGDEATARALVESLRAEGVDPAAIYLGVFAPGMMTIGDLWEQNKLSVAEEHLATAITERLIGLLSPLFGPPESRVERATAALGCVEGERHALGLRMLTDLFRRQGWRPLYLGADVPVDEWAALVTRYGVDAVALSASAQRHSAATRATIARLREARPELLILVGGKLFDAHPQLWQDVGADIYDPDPITAVTTLTDEYRRREQSRQSTPG